MTCEHVRKALVMLPGCFETENGSCFTTHCLYPSFESVRVYVIGFGDGFKVHDGGGAARSVWDHTGETAIVRRAMARQSAIYGIKVIDESLEAEAVSIDWLYAALMSVANASAAAAHEAIGDDHIFTARESQLKEIMYSVLANTVPASSIAKDHLITGHSGKKHKFDFAVLRPSDGWLLMDAITPHHVSIAAKFLAFSDTQNLDGNIGGRFVVYDRPLLHEDEALMQTVADVVPIASLQAGLQRELVH